MRRDHQQVASSTQDPNNPASFIFVTDNAARGENYGLESSAALRLSEQWQLQASAAWLRARYVDYRYVDPNTGEVVDLSGRQQAHAPDYQYSLSAEWRHPIGVSVRADVTGLGSFYFDSSNNQSSSAYRLVNLRAAYERDHWTASVWARNLFNTYYAQRGFFFALEPPDFPEKLYRQHGDPRQVGATVEWRF
jgi:outer membrane receptor protein involved in Fe transport